MTFRTWALCVALANLAMGSCSSTTSRSPATQHSTPTVPGGYRLPDTYEDHRSQQKFLQTMSGKIAYTDHGSGPVLVMLHGVPTSSWMYRKIIPELQASFRVVTIDFLGYGSSDKPKSSGAIYSTDNQAGCVREVLRQLGVSRYHLLFHDMGGLVGWRLLRHDLEERKKRIEGAVVLNTIISKEGFDHPKLKEGTLTRTAMKAYSHKLSSRAVLGMTFRSMGLTKRVKLTEEECRGYVAPMLEGSNEALYDFFTGLNEERFAKLDRDIQSLSAFDGAALVVWGAQDKVLTTKQLPRLFAQLSVPKENRKILRSNSHFLAEEIPIRLSGYVKEALLRP